MATLLCVPIMVLDEQTALADAAAARDAGADIVEYRVDELFSGSLDSRGELDQSEVRTMLRLVAECPLPCIVTCRAAEEAGGVGGYDGDEMARVSLYERLGTADGQSEHPPRYLDMEFAAYTRSANIRQKINLAVDHPAQRRDVRTGLILSTHDFGGRPMDLLRRVAMMTDEPAASVIKVAFTAKSIRDNLEIFDLLAEGAGGRPMIALAMGQFGLLSRVLAPKFGGFMTFASLRKSSATASGQPTVAELTGQYRFRAITARTRLFGLIGWPVEHSLGPLIHNAGFELVAPEELGGVAEAGSFNGVYLPLPVPPEWEHFKATLSALIDHPRLDFHGCSVTVPHKLHLVRFARESSALGADGIGWSIDELSHACGAANTLVIERDEAGVARRARVMNTDAKAAVSCLREVVGEVVGDLHGKRVAILGAGGVARAIAAGLYDAGAQVTVFNRTVGNAAELVADLTNFVRTRTDGASRMLVAADLAEFGTERFDAVINCTPVGMRVAKNLPESESHGTNRMPVTLEQVKGCASGGRELVVMDTVYNPRRTPLLQAAEGLGLRTIDGLGMFVRQAGEQFSAWTGRPAPLALFERVAGEALKDR